MSKPISRSESIKGREIWSGVSKAASSSPTWVRSQVSDASEFAAQKVRSEPDDPDYRYEFFDKEKFAELIAAEEREECARACEVFGQTLEVDVGPNFAEVIRARGVTE